MELKNNPFLMAIGIVIIIVIALLINDASTKNDLAENDEAEVAGISLESEADDAQIEAPDETPGEANETQAAASTAATSQPPAVAADDEAEEAQCSELGTFSEEFLCILNNHRVDNGALELALDDTLILVAEGHSIWMETNQDLNHVGVDDSRFFERCESVGTSCFAENIAFGFSGPDRLFEMWRRSGQHNQNMLGDYSSFGIGLSGTYATTLFR